MFCADANHIQYFDPANNIWVNPPPPLNAVAGQKIGVLLWLINTRAENANKTFTSKIKILDPKGIQVAYNEQSTKLGYLDLFSLLPVTVTKTLLAGDYHVNAQLYVDGAWLTNWKGWSLISDPLLIATVKSPVISPPPEPSPSPPSPDPQPTPPPPTSPPSDTYDYIEVGRATIVSVEDLEKYRFWDSSFRSGECGLAKLNFPIPLPETMPTWMKVMFPTALLVEKIYGVELSKAGISDYLNSYLPSKGVRLWKPVYWDGNHICIPFITGVAAVIILGIVVGVLKVLAVVVPIVIVLWKVGIAYVQAQKETILEGQDQILRTIDEIEDPELQAKLLSEYLGLYWEARESGSAGSTWLTLFKTPILIITISIVVLISVLLVIKVVRR